MRLMNDESPLPLPPLAETAAISEPLPQYWEYVASAYVVVALVMLWLVASGYRERLRLRKRQGTR